MCVTVLEQRIFVLFCLRFYVAVNNYFKSFWDGFLGLTSTKQWG